MNRNLYDVAREITDEVFGEGTYDDMNEHHPNPEVQAAIQRGKMNCKEEYVISKQAVKAVAETGTKISLQDARKKINAFLPLLETKVTYGPQK